MTLTDIEVRDLIDILKIIQSGYKESGTLDLSKLIADIESKKLRVVPETICSCGRILT